MICRITGYLLLIILTSCGIQDGRPNGVFIRVQNNSDVNFTDVVVQTGKVENAFGTINLRSFSTYKEFEYAFKFGAVWLKAEGHDFAFVPDDYVGELPLKNGFYTYRIGLNSANLSDASLVFNFVKD